MQRRTFRDQDPANIEAAELVGRLHDALADAGHRGHDLERFLVRVVFCMFADDTGVFEPRDIFLDFIELRTGEGGADLGPWLAQLFEVLDTPEDERAATLDQDLVRFPYVNGDLFEGHLRTFSFHPTCVIVSITALVDTSIVSTPDRTILRNHSNPGRRPTAEGYL